MVHLLQFQEAIVASLVSSIYDSVSNEAINGRGWSSLFAQETSSAATVAYNDFFSINANTVSISNKSKFDALAGLAISGVLIKNQNEDVFYLNVVIAAESLLNDSPNYELSYNTKINYKDVRYSLVQAHFNLSNFRSAADHLDILDPVNAPHSASPEDLLNSIQSLAGQL